MAVAREGRGAGLGGSLLGEQLRLHVDPSGAPAALATQRPENVRFYERLGFRVVSESRIGAKGPPFINWMMLRA